MKRSTFVRAALGLGAGAALARPAWAQGAYPNRPVQLVSAFPAGSGVDFCARMMAQKLSVTLGQPFVVVNKPGAGGSLATAFVAAAPADGYTLLANSAAITLYPALYPDAKFDAVRDLTAVAPVVDTELVLIAAPSKGWRTLNEFLEYARSKPGTVTYGSSGIGSTTQMAFERLALAAKISGVHIPFKGTPEAMNEVVTGRVDVTYGILNSSVPMIKSKQITPLAIAGRKRSALLPDVPTTLEAGLPESDYSTWTAIFAPSATPRAIVERLNQEVLAALADKDIADKLLNAGLVPLPGTTAQFATQLRNDFAGNTRLVKAVGIKPQ